jgi:hypothetical protein
MAFKRMRELDGLLPVSELEPEKPMHFCYFGVSQTTAPASAYDLDKT